jgi:hypothetical protein
MSNPKVLWGVQMSHQVERTPVKLTFLTFHRSMCLPLPRCRVGFKAIVRRPKAICNPLFDGGRHQHQVDWYRTNPRSSSRTPLPFGAKRPSVERKEISLVSHQSRTLFPPASNWSRRKISGRATYVRGIMRSQQNSERICDRTP